MEVHADPNTMHDTLLTNAGAFTELKQRLEALGYLEPLGLETAPLVERLVADLIATTDAYRNTKEDLRQLQSQEALNGEELVEPLRRANARLHRENGKLHKELITRQKEVVDLTKDKILTEKSLQVGEVDWIFESRIKRRVECGKGKAPQIY